MRDDKALYITRFPAPVAGMQIPVMLTPVTESGFQGQPVWTPVTIADAPHAAEPTLTLTLTLKK